MVHLHYIWVKRYQLFFCICYPKRTQHVFLTKIVSTKKLVINSESASFWIKICNFESSVISCKTYFSLYIRKRCIKIRELKVALSEQFLAKLGESIVCNHIRALNQEILLLNKLVFFIVQLSQVRASGNFFPQKFYAIKNH